MTPIHGHCHCGRVQFEVTPPVLEVTTCDCSLCAMRAAVMAVVPETSLTVLAGEDALTLYQWNTLRAKHYFCSHCGIYVFHRKRAAPERFGVNVRCLDGFVVDKANVRVTDGAGMSVVADAAR